MLINLYNIYKAYQYANSNKANVSEESTDANPNVSNDMETKHTQSNTIIRTVFTFKQFNDKNGKSQLTISKWLEYVRNVDNIEDVESELLWSLNVSHEEFDLGNIAYTSEANFDVFTDIPVFFNKYGTQFKLDSNLVNGIVKMMDEYLLPDTCLQPEHASKNIYTAYCKSDDGSLVFTN